jgi:hypothetical protein
MKKQYTAPTITVFAVRTSILSGSSEQPSLDMSQTGVNGNVSLSKKRTWEDWDED